MKITWILLLASSSLLGAKIVLLNPLGTPDQIFVDYSTSQQESAKVFFCLRKALEKEGYQVELPSQTVNVNEVVASISVNDNPYWGTLREIAKERRLHFIFESPIVIREFYDRDKTKIYGKIFVMFDAMVDGTNYFKFHYPQPRLEMSGDLPTFEQKTLCTMISSNKVYRHPKSLYLERERVIQFFLKRKIRWEFDLYGWGWESSPNWRGIIPNKWEVLKNYRFCFCYENMMDQYGYITEKIFDCFIAGCVPIYWGASNIEQYVPKECFIDRREFASNEDLYQFIKQIDRDTYEAYLASIQEYLKSSQAQLFSIDHFVQVILDEVARLESIPRLF